MLLYFTCPYCNADVDIDFTPGIKAHPFYPNRIPESPDYSPRECPMCGVEFPEADVLTLGAEEEETDA